MKQRSMHPSRGWACRTDPFRPANAVAALLLATCVVTVFTGCGGSNPDAKEIYSVSGQLFINGKPAVGALVTLAPESEGVPIPMGTVAQDGTFLMSISDQDLAKYPQRGNPAGEYHVLIRMPVDPSKPFSADRFQGAYANPDAFDHPVSIELGENELEPIRIENLNLPR